MSYKPFSDDSLNLIASKSIIFKELAEQCRRANALAEAVKRETWSWPDTDRVREALAAYLGDENEVEG